MRTWAVKGQTPVVQFHFNWHQLSLIAGMHFSGACFRLHEGTIAKAQVVEFLKALLAHWRRPLLILWDSLQAHRSRSVRDYVASTEGCIKLHFLPGYAPELDPVEFLWAWLKHHALANYCPDSFAELRQTARGKLESAQRRSVIIASCWQQAELFRCHAVTQSSISDAELGLLRLELLESSLIELPAYDSYRDELQVWIGARSRAVTVQHAPVPSAFARRSWLPGRPASPITVDQSL